MSKRNPVRGACVTQHQRRNRKSTATTNCESLVALQEQLFPSDHIFTHVKFHGNTSWAPRDLVWQALFWSWSEYRNVTDAFCDAARWSKKISGTQPLSTYQGFLGALTRWTAIFIPLLWSVLQMRMEEWGGKFWRIDGWVPIAFDGSRSTVPRSRANEKAFCAANYGQGMTSRYRKKKTRGMRRTQNERNRGQPPKPQAWITLLWHMGLRLPWSWRLGPSNSSERAHVMELVGAGEFPSDTLFCGDAGFVGYPLWSAILRSGSNFLVRVGANASLLTEGADFQQQKNGMVLCWPKAMIRVGEPPLHLRLVLVGIGKTKVWILTSVLDATRLSNQQIVKFYKMRWGIEVEFRGLKQTLSSGKLCCRNDQRLLAELHWSLLAMTVAELLALKEQLSVRRWKNPRNEYVPAKLSLAQTIRALRQSLTNLHEIPPLNQDLRSRLRAAVTDDYERSACKCARYRPPNRDKKPLGNPNLRSLTVDERIKLKDIHKIAA